MLDRWIARKQRQAARDSRQHVHNTVVLFGRQTALELELMFGDVLARGVHRQFERFPIHFLLRQNLPPEQRSQL